MAALTQKPPDSGPPTAIAAGKRKLSRRSAARKSRYERVSRVSAGKVALRQISRRSEAGFGAGGAVIDVGQEGATPVLRRRWRARGAIRRMVLRAPVRGRPGGSSRCRHRSSPPGRLRAAKRPGGAKTNTTRTAAPTHAEIHGHEFPKWRRDVTCSRSMAVSASWEDLSPPTGLISRLMRSSAKGATFHSCRKPSSFSPRILAGSGSTYRQLRRQPPPGVRRLSSIEYPFTMLLDSGVHRVRGQVDFIRPGDEPIDHPQTTESESSPPATRPDAIRPNPEPVRAPDGAAFHR